VNQFFSDSFESKICWSRGVTTTWVVAGDVCNDLAARKELSFQLVVDASGIAIATVGELGFV